MLVTKYSGPGRDLVNYTYKELNALIYDRNIEYKWKGNWNWNITKAIKSNSWLHIDYPKIRPCV